MKRDLRQRKPEIAHYGAKEFDKNIKFNGHWHHLASIFDDDQKGNEFDFNAAIEYDDEINADIERNDDIDTYDFDDNELIEPEIKELDAETIEIF